MDLHCVNMNHMMQKLDNASCNMHCGKVGSFIRFGCQPRPVTATWPVIAIALSFLLRTLKHPCSSPPRLRICLGFGSSPDNGIVQTIGIALQTKVVHLLGTCFLQKSGIALQTKAAHLSATHASQALIADWLILIHACRALWALFDEMLQRKRQTHAS